MVEVLTKAEEITESDIKSAVKSLKSASFKSRFIRPGRDSGIPVMEGSNRESVKALARKKMEDFREDVKSAPMRNFHNGVYQKFETNTLASIAHNHWADIVTPKARKSLWIYNPDRDNTRDWKRYYRYAWKSRSLGGTIFSKDADIIQRGMLSCSAHSYSGQNAYAMAGTGIFYRPQRGDAKVNIRPYVQWLTNSSFTGDTGIPASAAAYIGIYVNSWGPDGGLHHVDRDYWIRVWSHNTRGHITGFGAEGTAAVADGLATEFLAVKQRKYSIFAYVYVETSAEPRQQKNHSRFVVLDIDATVPFMVLEEKFK